MIACLSSVEGEKMILCAPAAIRPEKVSRDRRERSLRSRLNRYLTTGVDATCKDR
jgi:hypothetical protein